MLAHVDTAAYITSLDDIPIHSKGRIAFPATLSPTGSAGAYNYICYGYPTYRSLQVTSVTQGTFFNYSNNGSWTGWTRAQVGAERRDVGSTAGDLTFDYKSQFSLLIAIHRSSTIDAATEGYCILKENGGIVHMTRKTGIGNNITIKSYNSTTKKLVVTCSSAYTTVIILPLLYMT